MCATCGCSDHADPSVTALGQPGPDHHHPHDHEHAHDHHHDTGTMPHVHARPAPRIVQIEQDVLAKNDRLAEHNRGWLDGRGIRGVEPDELARGGQDHAPRAHDPGPRCRASDLRDRGRSGDAARRRAHPGDGLPGSADQHRQRLPSRCRDARRGPAAARSPDAFAPDDRERRQPGVPGPLRSRRAHEGRHHVGDRRRGQTAQVPAHVPRQRGDGAEQDRSAAAPRVRRRAVPGPRPPGEPAPRDRRDVGDAAAMASRTGTSCFAAATGPQPCEGGP